LMLGRHIHMKNGVLRSMLYWGPGRREEVAHRRVVEDIIDFLEIEAIRKRPVGSLPYGLQKRVELGRALALHPKVLLLDEPMGGTNHEEKEDMARFVLDVNDEWGTTIILIEHDMGVVMDISRRVVVLDLGEKIAEGTPAEVKANPQVVKAYLGTKASAYEASDAGDDPSAVPAQKRPGASGRAGAPGEGERHLAGVELGGLPRARPRHRPRPGEPGLPSRRQAGPSERQPSAGVRRHGGCPGGGRGSRARLPGLH